MGFLGKINAPYTLRKLKQKPKPVEDLEFISGFLAFDISKRPRLLVEQAFSVFLGYALNYDQITHILKLNNPSSAFNLLQKSKGYIELKGGTFQWAQKKRSSPRAYTAKYFVLAYIALIPALVVFAEGLSIGIPSLLIISVWTITFWGLAFDSLNKGTAVEAAEKLLEEQAS